MLNANITFSSKAAIRCPYLSISYLFPSKTWTTKSRWRPPEKLKARFIGHRKLNRRRQLGGGGGAKFAEFDI